MTTPDAVDAGGDDAHVDAVAEAGTLHADVSEAAPIEAAAP
jgi:hypothetical protein